MKKHVIFDLDQTLVDSAIAKPYRSARDWKTVYSLIPQFKLYPGIQEVFEYIRKNDNVKTCVVSTAPSTYVRRVVDYFNMPIHFIVGYHDAKPIKPSPMPMLKALELLKALPQDAISFGDRVIDIHSSNAAGIESVACSWGTEEEINLANCDYSHYIGKPVEMMNFIGSEQKNTHICTEKSDSMASHQQIIAVQNIEGYGPATNKKVSEYIIRNSMVVNNADDLFFVLEECHKSKLVRRSKPNSSVPTHSEVSKAWNQAEEIVSKCGAMGIGIVSAYDTCYPDKLKRTVNEQGKLDFPLLLYYKGDLSVATKPGVAIIGTREPNADGIKAGLFFGEKFAEKGFNIVSGLALGCDTSGHMGALKCPKGKTTAFLAHGLDTIYPVENVQLANDIIEKGGLLMSEYPIGTPVNRYNLVSRDRLQAGLADATLVIQTGIAGGTMHAVNATLAAGKPLFCVSYSNFSTQNSPQVQGNLLLVKEGKAEAVSADESIYMPVISRILEQGKHKGVE